MKHRTLFLLAAIVLFIYGLVWLVFPAVGLNLFGHGVETMDLASIIARYWGSAFLGLAVILWLARSVEENSIALKAIIAGGFVMCVTGLAGALIDAFWGGSNDLIWLPVALYVIFGIWFGALLVKKQA